MKQFLRQLELFFRHSVVYPVLRILLRNTEAALPVDLAKVSSLLVLRYDKIGDMVVTLPIFRILKRRNPSLRIGVLTSEANLDILEGESSVSDRFVLFKNPFKLARELMRLRRAGYEVVVNFIFNRTTSGGLIANFVCPRGLKIGQGAETYRFYFDALLSLPRASMHMFEILVFYIEQVFGFVVGEKEKRLSIEISDGTKEIVDGFLGAHRLQRRNEVRAKRSPYIVLNISAREWNKRISVGQASFLTKLLSERPGITTVVISAPEDIPARESVLSGTKSEKCIAFPERGVATMHEIASLIEGAVCVITPDTSIVHVASATSTEVLGLFTPLQVNREWLPYKTKYAAIVARDGQPVSAIPLETLRTDTETFLQGVLRQKGRTKRRQ